jgi:predicted transcriptional regulator
LYIKGIKNFFPVPNCIFNLGLSSGEIAVYLYLMCCENRITNKCYPSYNTIGKNLGMCKLTVKKYVDMLCGKELISVEPTKITLKDGRRMNGNLEYTILPIQNAVDSYYDRQMRALERVQNEQLLKQRMLEYERLKGV